MSADNTPPATPAPAALAELPPDTRAAQAVALFGAAQDQVFCSFDPTTDLGGVLLDKCEESPDHKLIEVANLRFRVSHIYAHFVSLVDRETSEVNDRLRICLISDAGEVFSCVSEGVRKSVRRLMLKKGLPPWKPALPVVVSLKRIGPDRQWLTIQSDPTAVADSPAASAVPKGKR